MGDPIVLRKLAIDMIKRNNLSKAKLALSKSLAIDATLHDTYTILGDVYFLENKKTTAKQYYLAAMHLLILSYIKEVQDERIEYKYNLLPKELQDSIPCKYAMYILNEYTISYHLGHAILDQNSNSYEKVFREALITKLTLNSVLSKHSLSYEDYLEYRNSNIIPLGRNYLIKNINWDLIKSNNVQKLYLK